MNHYVPNMSDLSNYERLILGPVLARHPEIQDKYQRLALRPLLEMGIKESLAVDWAVRSDEDWYNEYYTSAFMAHFFYKMHNLLCNDARLDEYFDPYMVEWLEDLMDSGAVTYREAVQLPRLLFVTDEAYDGINWEARNAPPGWSTVSAQCDPEKDYLVDRDIYRVGPGEAPDGLLDRLMRGRVALGDDSLLLFHGTPVAENALTMAMGGIDVTAGRAHCDFNINPCYYMGENFDMARQWAHDGVMREVRAERRRNPDRTPKFYYPAVVVFHVKREELCRDREQYHLTDDTEWSNAIKCHRSMRRHKSCPVKKSVEIVSGKICANPTKLRQEEPVPMERDGTYPIQWCLRDDSTVRHFDEVVLDCFVVHLGSMYM